MISRTRLSLIVFGWSATSICASCAFAVPASFPPQATLAEVEQRVRACSPEHPRLLASREQLTGLAGSLEKDPLRRELATALIEEADRVLKVPPIERVLIGRRLLDKSRTCVSRVLVLSLAYYLTGEERYVDRCQQEMLAAARFTDWNPDHFLDTAEMTFALGVGYDWLYSQLDEPARNEIRGAIVQKGVQLPRKNPNYSWIRRENNWGQVCHGGITVGSLAVLEDEPELAAYTVHNAVHNVVHAMNAIAPAGSYPEGPSYWSYGTSYNVFLIAALESSLGTCFGLDQAPGFDKTGGYLTLVRGPSGRYFNYADGSADRRVEPIRMWLATRYQRSDWLQEERTYLEHILSVRKDDGGGSAWRQLALAMLWMESASEAASPAMPLHWQSKGKVPIAIHRSSWQDPNATFVGVKAGAPRANHGHMDIGSFVLDSDGVRWAIDLGPEPYHPIEARGMALFDSKQKSDRWTIFRLNNFSHNTLVIEDQLQVAAGNATIESFSDNPRRPFTIVDMSSVYEGQVTSARRGFTLLPSREVLIQDELTGLKPGSRVRWGMLTAGVPEGLGASRIVLRQSKKQLTLAALVPTMAEWTEIDTAKPRHEWDSPNHKTRMVAFETIAPPSGKLTLAVVATPGSCTKPSGERMPFRPLAKWAAH
ncbi:MAG: heparinase II/III family protein [Pirellulales bacterium]|nr:heparinase II/III family protein [Pirellulales bacterium]